MKLWWIYVWHCFIYLGLITYIFIQLQIYLGYTANTYALFHSYVYGYCARYQIRSAVILLAANLRSSAWRWRTPHSLHPLLKAEIVLCIRLLNILILRKHWKYNVHWVKVHPDLLRSKLHQFNLSANRTTSTSTGTLISTVAKYFTEIIQVPLLGTH